MESQPPYDLDACLPLERRDPMRALYALLDPRSAAVRYIGQTPDPLKRLATHIATRKTTKTGVGAWIRELAALGLAPTMRVFAYVADQDAATAESRAIIQAHEAGAELLNVLGFGHDSASISAVQRARYERERAQGIKRTRTAEQRARIAAGTKTAMDALAPDWKARGAAARQTPEFRARMSQAKRGHKQSEEWVAKRVASQAARPDYRELQSRASRARWDKHRARLARESSPEES